MTIKSRAGNGHARPPTCCGPRTDSHPASPHPPGVQVPGEGKVHPQQVQGASLAGPFQHPQLCSSSRGTSQILGVQCTPPPTPVRTEGPVPRGSATLRAPEGPSEVTFSTSWMCSCRSTSVMRSTYHLSTLMRSLKGGRHTRVGWGRGVAEGGAQRRCQRRPGRQERGLTCRPGRRRSGSRCTCPSRA